MFVLLDILSVISVIVAVIPVVLPYLQSDSGCIWMRLLLSYIIIGFGSSRSLDSPPAVVTID